jgi:hypothetical protein
MSNPLTFMNNFFQLNVECIQVIQRMRTANDQLIEDPTLIDRYFAIPPPGQPGAIGPGVPRTDITKADVQNAQTSFQQLFYTLDNATPAWKSYMYKMLP